MPPGGNNSPLDPCAASVGRVAVMAGNDAGVQVACPGCSETVLQKSMIPVVLAGQSEGFSYLCRACARKQLDAKALQTG